MLESAAPLLLAGYYTAWTHISTRRALKQAHHSLGSVSHSILFWVTLPYKSAAQAASTVSDDQFWKNLGKLMRYVRKDSGRIVLHMPRKSKTWQHASVRAALEAFGLHKGSFSLNEEATTVATNDC